VKPLKQGDHGTEVERLQAAYNDRARPRGFALIDVDGDFGPETALAFRRIGRALGAKESTLKQAVVSIGLQRIIRWPTSRTPVQLVRAAQRKRAAKKASRTMRERAWRIAGQCLDIREVGHNRGRRVDEIVRYAGGDLGEAYCVDGMIWCYGHAGSQIVRRGYTRAVRYMLTTGLRATAYPRRGDLIRFVFDHTGMFGGWRRLIRGRYVACPRSMATHILTREFNTSSSGAQSSDANDGTDGCYEKIRHRSLVRDYLIVQR